MSPPVTGRCRFQVSDEQRRRGRTATTEEIFRAGGVRPALGRSSLLQIRPRGWRHNRGESMTTEPTYDAPAKLIWELWTTAAGLGEWFAPDGFESRVSELELRPGGQLRYTMTATAPEQVAFMRNTGNPLSAEVRKTFTEVAPPTRLAYLSLIDFVPGHEPYEHLTPIDIEPAGDRTNVVMTVDPLHDETWTQQHRAHRANELDNLEAAIRRRTM